MLRSVLQIHLRERGQALVLFAVGLVGFLGLVGMSVDVGRLVWARTSIQAGVDAAALAAAQSMPNQTDATAKANEYWLKNSSFIQSSASNINFSVTFPTGNKALEVHADAQIGTWFAKFVGLDHWTVGADAGAASQVLDVAMVLDISGSMCDDSYNETETPGIYRHMSPGRAASIPKLTAAISAPTANSITISVNSVALFNSTSSTFNSTNFGTNTTSRYYQYPSSGSRKGMIRIDQELFQITALNATTNKLTVTRAMPNNFTGAATTQAPHAVGAELWANRSTCYSASRFTPTSAVKGPNERYDTTIEDAKYFMISSRSPRSPARPTHAAPAPCRISPLTTPR